MEASYVTSFNFQIPLWILKCGAEVGKLPKFTDCKKQGSVLGQIKSIFYNCFKMIFKGFF